MPDHRRSCGEGVRRSGASWVDEAELGQCLDPARGITLNGECFIVGRGIPVMFAPLEHEEDDKHWELDRKLQAIDAGTVQATRDEVEVLKKKKLGHKDQIYSRLRECSTATNDTR